MKKLAVILIAAGGLLSGCVAYDTPIGESDITRGNPNYGTGPYAMDGRAYYNRDGRTY